MHSLQQVPQPQQLQPQPPPYSTYQHPPPLPQHMQPPPVPPDLQFFNNYWQLQKQHMMNLFQIPPNLQIQTLLQQLSPNFESFPNNPSKLFNLLQQPPNQINVSETKITKKRKNLDPIEKKKGKGKIPKVVVPAQDPMIKVDPEVEVTYHIEDMRSPGPTEDYVVVDDTGLVITAVP